MARIIDVPGGDSLDDYAAVAQLAPAVAELRAEAARVAPLLEGRTVWMINSTERGGGVAEMLPTMVTLLRELGVRTEWVVLEADRPAFFDLTKRIHNLIHGAGEPDLTGEEHALYEAVNRANLGLLLERVSDGDVVVVHDPQPMPLAPMLREERDVLTVWRCHIGVDEVTPQTRCAWTFLQPYAEAYDRAVFSAPEYIPSYLAGRATIIHPAIDPLSPKNRELHFHHMIGVLVNAALAVGPGPVVRPPFPHLAQRLQPDGRFAPAILPEDIGLLTRPIVLQVSRWDRLKGWYPLMRGFERLKERVLRENGRIDPLHQRRLSLVRLVLAGPDPASIQDDPEGLEVLDELTAEYRSLHPSIQDDVALVALPMDDPRYNALMVNALQRASTIVAQNSLREGFGLTVTEAMWKRIPILSNSRAVGPRHQVRDGIDGRLVADPEDVEEIASMLDSMLRDASARDAWARNAQRRVQDEFLNFGQIRNWLWLLGGLVSTRR